MNQPISIGSRRELFVDDYLIGRRDGVHLDLKRPERREAFPFDAPWEDSGAFPSSLTAAAPFGAGRGLVRLYYRASIGDRNDAEGTMLGAVAESRDGGLSFTRPNLGRHEFRGSKANNIVGIGFQGAPPAFLDTNPACDASERYKGLGSYAGRLYALCSADGIAWRPMRKAPLDYSGAFDTINTAFWDTVAGCYRSYTRVWINRETPEGLARIRCIQSAVSPDFIHWSNPVENEYADGENDVHLYTNAALPCPGAEHIYVAFPNRFMERRWIRRDDDAMPEYTGCNDGLFMASRDGVRWTRYLDAWVRPGGDPRNWSQRNNYPTWGLTITSGVEWSMYVSEHYAQPDQPARLRRLAVRPHGFVSAHADYRGGEFTTKPLIFDGRRLRLNYATSAAGDLRVEIQGADGRPLDGFGIEDMDPLFGDEIDGGVTWKGGCDLAGLAGTPVRLRFVMRDADLFALRFSATELDVIRGAVALPAPPTYRTRALRAEVRVRRAAEPPALDGDTRAWDWSEAVTIRTPDQYADSCNARVAMLYDAEALYVAGAVADPYPMVNALPFDGDINRSWEADALQLHLRAVTDATPGPGGADINDIRLWYSTKDRAAGCCVILGADVATARVNPAGARGAYRRRGDGTGYSFTYRLPWAALNSARGPRPGERLTACIQCHWGPENGEGMLCGGVEIRADNAPEVYVAESWGQAVFE